MFGKLAHLAFDAVLVTTVLAGIQRTTGITPAVDKIQHGEVRKIISKYLEIGEWTLDIAILVLSRSSIFERKRS